MLNWLKDFWLDHFYFGVLVDYQIESLIRRGKLKVSNFDPSLINPTSLDIRLSRHFSKVEHLSTRGPVDPLDKHTYSATTFEADEVIIKANGALLGSTLEIIELPDNLSYRLIGKSSLARLHFDNSSFGAWAEADFGGSLVMEFVNHAKFPIKLTAGMKIGQLVFYKHPRVRTPYSKKKDSKYHKQASASASLYWKNKNEQ